MLAQEIIHSIKKPKIGDNVVIKLDMAKAYDRVSWSFICLVMRRMGFGEMFIDMVWRTMPNNWYSVIINGTRHGFFHSTRGLKQGDPLSPAFFILGAEVLSRMLNNLHQHYLYSDFQMERKGPQINHLSFADDVIIFTSTSNYSLKLIIKTLQLYETTSGQLINKDKSQFMIPENTPTDIVDRVHNVTGFRCTHGPITSLGCPVYIGGQRIIYFTGMVSKVISRIKGWQTKILSYGGRVTLIKSVLQSLPIHLLNATTPTSTTLKQIKCLIADFFWGWENEKRKYHWASWDNLSFPYDEGGIGVKRLEDVCLALQYKQWSIFRSKRTLWGEFLKAKYCQRAHPVIKKWDTGQSLTWKHMTINKSDAETNIQWSINSGTCRFWWDDWLGVGPLAYHNHYMPRLNNITVSKFLINGVWDKEKIRHHAPHQLVHKILSITIQYQANVPDQAYWKLNSHGKFTSSSAWEHIRRKKSKTLTDSLIWHKCIPFKVSFLLWRAIRFKLPTNEKIISFGHEPANCSCCYRPGLDNIDHIFVAGHFAKHIWNHFSNSWGVQFNNSPLRNLLMNWWVSKTNNEVHKLMLQATPIFVCWNIWKNRCASKYGGKKSSTTRVKFSIVKDLYNLILTVYPYINWPNSWNDLVIMVENCKHDLRVTQVNWFKPPPSIVKLNTDRSALDNPGKIGAGGIIRNHKGNLIYAFATPLGLGSNNQAEVQAAVFGIIWCIQHGYSRVMLEVDSELLVKWLKQEINPPWNIKKYIIELIELVNLLEFFQCKHVYREANFPADTLSKYSHMIDSTHQFYNYQQLPHETKGYYKLDKLGMPCYRRKKLKRIKKPP